MERIPFDIGFLMCIVGQKLRDQGTVVAYAYGKVYHYHPIGFSEKLTKRLAMRHV
jgi:hypothetical protein